MTQSLVMALERAFEEARDRSVSLGERLRHVAATVSALSPPYENAINALVERLEAANAGSQAPQIGEPMPGFILPDDQGKLVSLDRLLENGPVAIAFHRGHWCPYCRLSAHGLAQIEDDIKPVQIVAISAETQAYTRAIKAEAQAHFPFLTDVGNGYALSLNLAIWVDDSMSAMIEAAGWDIPKYQGQDGWILPIPSVFVVGQDGLITARHVDPDYRRRLELDDLRAAAKSALNGPTVSRAGD
jgi:peroxiredoxin